MLRYEVVEDALYPGTWRAEAIDREGDGECHVVIFSGPEAEERAQEYARWKNAETAVAVAFGKCTWPTSAV